MENRSRIIRWVTALILLLLFGTFGYVIIERWDIFDAFYMTVITISTVGYAEVKDLSTAGRIFSIVLILGGVGTAFFILTSLVQATLEGEFGIFRRRRMEARIKKLNNHFILCGYGRVGESIADTLKRKKLNLLLSIIV
jgi:voltage-gated potassium channel